MATFGLRRKTLRGLDGCVRARIELADRQDPLAVILAKFIIELAKEGERDPDKLCEGALKILRKPR